MNLPANTSGLEDSAAHLLRLGHKHARHAAAEIASEGDALIAEMLAALTIAESADNAGCPLTDEQCSAVRAAIAKARAFGDRS